MPDLLSVSSKRLNPVSWASLGWEHHGHSGFEVDKEGWDGEKGLWAHRSFPSLQSGAPAIPSHTTQPPATSALSPFPKHTTHLPKCLCTACSRHPSHATPISVLQTPTHLSGSVTSSGKRSPVAEQSLWVFSMGSQTTLLIPPLPPLHGNVSFLASLPHAFGFPPRKRSWALSSSLPSPLHIASQDLCIPMEADRWMVL